MSEEFQQHNEVVTVSTEKVEVSTFHKLISTLRSKTAIALYAATFLHAPFIFGTTRNESLNLMAPHSNLTLNSELVVDETIKQLAKDQNISEEEAREIVENTDEEIIRRYQLTRKVVELRKAERAQRIDAKRVQKYKEDLRKRIESGNPPAYSEFVFDVEEIAMGVHPDVIRKGKTEFAKEMRFLEQFKPKIPTREFLRKIISHTESFDNRGSYELTRTSLADYMARKGDGKRGNCQARGKFGAMALESLYPEYKDQIRFQSTGNHVRAIFDIGDESFMMEAKVLLLTTEEKVGTVFYTPLDQMKNFAGMEIGQLKVEKSQAKIDKSMDGRAAEILEDAAHKKAIEVIMDNTAFPPLDSDGKLRDSDEDMSGLYKDLDMLPDELEELEKAALAEKQSNKKRWGKLDLSFNVLKREDDQIVEVTPFEQKEYDDSDLFFFSDPINRLNLTREISPTVMSVKNWNYVSFTEYIYGDMAQYSREAIAAAFMQMPGSKMTINLKGTYLPMALHQVMATEDTYARLRNDLTINIDRSESNIVYPEKCHEKVETPYGKVSNPACFPAEQWKTLMQGSGALRLYYSGMKVLDEGEMQAIANSSRPSVFLDGQIDIHDTEIFKIMLESKGTVLLLPESVYFTALYEDPTLALNEKVKLASLAKPDYGFAEHRQDLTCMLANLELTRRKVRDLKNHQLEEKVEKIINSFTERYINHKHADYVSIARETVDSINSLPRLALGGHCPKTYPLAYCSRLKPFSYAELFPDGLNGEWITNSFDNTQIETDDQIVSKWIVNDGVTYRNVNGVEYSVDFQSDIVNVYQGLETVFTALEVKMVDGIQLAILAENYEENEIEVKVGYMNLTMGLYNTPHTRKFRLDEQGNCLGPVDGKSTIEPFSLFDREFLITKHGVSFYFDGVKTQKKFSIRIPFDPFLKKLGIIRSEYITMSQTEEFKELTDEKKWQVSNELVTRHSLEDHGVLRPSNLPCRYYWDKRKYICNFSIPADIK